MNGLGQPVQRHAIGPILLGLLLSLVASSSAHADDANPAALVAARELFRQGTEDADAGRFADALAKFRRVAAVKESPAVRFNIARCEESLGKTGAALADFELAQRSASQDPQHSAEDVARLAQDRADALRPKVPRLALVAPSLVPDGLTVTLDGAKVGLGELGVPLPLDPGVHVLDARAPNRAPFHAELTLAAGESKSVALAVDTPAPATEPAAPAPETSPLAPASSHGSAQRTWGWVTFGAGAAFGGASLVFMLLHNSDVSDLNDACAGGGHCPIQREAELNDTHSRAVTEQTLSTVFVAASGAAVVTGVLLLITAPSTPRSEPMASTPSARFVPGAPGAPAGFSLQATF